MDGMVFVVDFLGGQIFFYSFGFCRCIIFICFIQIEGVLLAESGVFGREYGDYRGFYFSFFYVFRIFLVFIFEVFYFFGFIVFLGFFFLNSQLVLFGKDVSIEYVINDVFKVGDVVYIREGVGDEYIFFLVMGNLIGKEEENILWGRCEG